MMFITFWVFLSTECKKLAVARDLIAKGRRTFLTMALDRRYVGCQCGGVKGVKGRSPLKSSGFVPGQRRQTCKHAKNSQHVTQLNHNQVHGTRMGVGRRNKHFLVLTAGEKVLIVLIRRWSRNYVWLLKNS